MHAIKLLLVEDNAAQAHVIERMIGGRKQSRSIICWSPNLADAVRRLKLEAYDVVLLDLNLPDSSGIETYRSVSAVSPHMPVVVLTADDDQALALEAVGEGAQDFLVKGTVDGQTIFRSALYAIERHRRQSAEEQLLRVQEQERKRVARDLHDSVVQSLMSLRLELQMLGTRVARNECELADQIQCLAHDASSVAEEVRRICRDLHPEVLDCRPLHEAIHWYSSKLLSGAGVTLKFDLRHQEPLEPTVKQHLFRIFQEILRNAAQHSQAQTISVGIYEDRDELVLTVEDDGCGFERREDRGSGLGLISLRERTELLKGTLHIDSGCGRGTLVTVRTPLRMKTVVKR